MGESKEECDRALALLASLERHTLNGRHLCANNVVIDLLFNMRVSLERLKIRLQAREFDYADDPRFRLAGGTSSSGGGGGGSGRGDRRGSVDSVPLSSVEALLGEYREALLSASNRVTQLEQELAVETEKSAQLRSRLTDFFQFQADSRDPASRNRPRNSTSAPTSGHSSGQRGRVERDAERSSAARAEMSEASALAQLDLSELDQDIEKLKDDLRKSADRRAKELLLAHLDTLLPLREDALPGSQNRIHQL